MEALVAGNEEGEAEEGGEDGEQPEHGERKVRNVQSPTEPTQSEREEHEKTHLPYRSWRRHCVRGMAVQMPHFSKLGDQGVSTPEVHMDYGFLGKEVVELLNY